MSIQVGRDCRWAVRHELLAANPMDRIDAIKVPMNLPRLAPAADIKKVFGVICTRRPRKDVALARLRDRMLFETAYVCGARAGYTAGPLFRASINGAGGLPPRRPPLRHHPRCRHRRTARLARRPA